MAEKLYRIGEAANLLNVKTSVLRFWEDSFTQLTPIRTEKGQRLYRERDLAVLRQIQHLLYERGLTIEGARRVLSHEGARRVLSHEDVVVATEQGTLLSFLPASTCISYKKTRTEKESSDFTVASSEYSTISEQSPVIVAHADADGVLCDIMAELQRLRDMLS